MEKVQTSNTGISRNDPSKMAIIETRIEKPESSSSDSDIIPVIEEAQVTEDEYLDGFKLAAVLSAVTLTAFLMLLDTSVVVTAIPKITTQFGSTADIGWYGSAYLLCK